MPEARNPLIEFVHRLVGDSADPDATLLHRFAMQHDTLAFTALVKRHGPMVLGVCQRILPDINDAEDAFQATFLVLAKKAGCIKNPDLLAPWLYGVASRAAARLKADAIKRQQKEQRTMSRPNQEPSDEVIWLDLRPVLDEEIRRLPKKYRNAFVLCYLEGVTNEKAAALLGCPTGTVLSRLATARERLRGQLTRRGITLSAGLLAALVTAHATAAVPIALATTTARAASLAAGQVVSAKVVSLVDGVLKTMEPTTAKVATGTVLVLGVATLATLMWADQGGIERGIQPNEHRPMTELDKLQGVWVAVAVEKQGDPIPEARIREAKLSLIISGDRFTLKNPRNTGELAGTLTINPRENPKKMDWTAVRPVDGKILETHGIYALDGDTLKFCYGEERPTEFKTKPAPELDQHLYVFKRGPDALSVPAQPPSLFQTMDGFRRKLPEPQGPDEMEGPTITNADGTTLLLGHLRGIASRLGVKTKADCMLLLTYLNDRDLKVRCIASFAMENIVKAYPNGLPKDCLDHLDSESHRDMVRRFVAGIEKLPN
jgi:RNA polymerase sigma factor (sigma-70 family)